MTEISGATVIELTSHNEAETLAIGRALAAVTRPGDVVAIDGPLGAGKTRLVRGLAMGMGFDGSVVSSPTFVVVNEYVRGEDEAALNDELATLPPGGGARLFHVDAYRLSGPDDLDSLGWDRVMDGSAVVAVEWAERIGGAWASGKEQVVWGVRMEAVGGPEEHGRGGARRIEITPPGNILWKAREGARELIKLARVMGGEAGDGIPLPRGWVRCAISGKPVPPDSPTFPFADERSRMADLGKWMSGAYTVSREITEDDEGVPPA